MNHKRKRPRNARVGCKLCKPWKVNGFATERKDGERFSDHRRRKMAEEQVRNYWTLADVVKMFCVMPE